MDARCFSRSLLFESLEGRQDWTDRHLLPRNLRILFNSCGPVDEQVDADAGPLERDRPVDDGVGTERGECQRLRLQVVRSKQLFLLDREVNLLVFEGVEDLGQVGCLKAVLGYEAVFFALEVSIKSLSVIIGQIVLDVGATAAGQLWAPCERDLDLVGLNLLVGLLFIDHAVDFDELRRRLEPVLRYRLQLVFHLFHLFGLLDETKDDLLGLIFLGLARHLLVGFIELVRLR